MQTLVSSPRAAVMQAQPARPSATAGSGFREFALAGVAALAIMTPLMAGGGWLLYDEWRSREDARLAAIAAAEAHERLVAAPAQPLIPVELATRGREVFMTTCLACHGPEGKGMPGLGKNLCESDFVALQSDEQLTEFLVTGRPTARPAPMPPRGGRPDLTDADLAAAAAWVRCLQDPRRAPELPEYVAAPPPPPTEEEQAQALAAAGGDPELAAWIASGNKLFHSTCVACHGQGGVGVQGNGKMLVKNQFIQSLDDDGLLAFIKRGRDPGDPKNTTGIQMPPKGGNPALSEDDILDIISYLRTLQGAPAAKSE